jgi:glycosyltransferase involved in cell wall biosynthesis
MNTSGLRKVSIIMPAYNRANYIAETINSVQKQTYSHWELIIIDDGSDDDTSTIVQSIKDSRIQFYQQEHGGMEKALSHGMKKACGDFIALIDSDDLWAAEKLEKQIKVMEQYPDAGFCMSGGYNFQKAGEALDYFYSQKSGLKYGDFLISFFKSEIPAVTSSMFFRKDCLRHTGEFLEVSLSHIYYMITISMHFKGVILLEPLVFRRLHESNDSTIYHAERHNDGIQMIRHFKANLPYRIFADSMFRSHVHFGEKCLEKSKQSKAVINFLQAWRFKPFSIVPLKKIAKSVLHARYNAIIFFTVSFIDWIMTGL